MELKVKLMDGAPLPRHAKPGDAGMDLTTREKVSLAPGETVTVGTGVAVEIPDGYVGLVFPRSGLGARGINLSNCVGVIDSGYRGEIKVPLHNNHHVDNVLVNMGEDVFGAEFPLRVKLKGESMTVERGERVAQLVVVPVVQVECMQVDELSDSERGSGGFGSSGRVELAE